MGQVYAWYRGLQSGNLDVAAVSPNRQRCDPEPVTLIMVPHFKHTCMPGPLDSAKELQITDMERFHTAWGG